MKCAGYVRGETVNNFIAYTDLRNSGPDFLNELYEGSHGDTIVYALDYDRVKSIEDARNQIKNPHSITNSWDGIVSGIWKDSTRQPTAVTGEHFPCLPAYDTLYRDFYSAIISEQHRVEGGAFNVLPSAYNTVQCVHRIACVLRACVLRQTGRWCGSPSTATVMRAVTWVTDLVGLSRRRVRCRTTAAVGWRRSAASSSFCRRRRALLWGFGFKGRVCVLRIQPYWYLRTAPSALYDCT